MSVWKQIAIAIVVLLVAAAAWVRFFPGSGALLAQWGIDWIPVTASDAAVPGPAQANRGRQAGPQSSVVTETVADATINDRLSAIGTGRANQSVSITPYASGRLIEVRVKSGAVVEAGDVIARLDSEGEQIAFDRATIALRDAEQRLERIDTLRRTNTASAVQVTEATLAVENARLELRDAELNLARRTIEAPISGVVGIVPITSGNYVTTTTQIATIDDRSEIQVDFWVPERFASLLKVGTPLTASLISRPDDRFSGAVSAIDNRVDAESRTMQVQARIANETDSLRAGMAFRVEIRFPGDTYPSVDPLAVQWGTEGAFVWAVRGGRAERVPVRIIQRNTESVLVDASLSPGDEVVTQGIHAVREGAEVLVARSGGSAAPAPTNTPAAGATSGS